MRISCVLSASELTAESPDLIVFPEGISWGELMNTQLTHPASIAIGAIAERGLSRGVLLHGGRNRVTYLKVGGDGRTAGSANVHQSPVYKFDDVCIGVLICMDFDHVVFSRGVVKDVQSSRARLKIVCVPSDMGAHWLGGDTLPFPQEFEGVYVVLCNHTRTHQIRCKSFIADTQGKKIVVQIHQEPIHVELP